MTSYTLPSPDLSGPLSKRAVQILRELQGLRLLDPSIPTLSEEVRKAQNAAQIQPSVKTEKIDPPMNLGEVKSQSPKPNTNTLQPKNRVFSKDSYLADVRSNLLGKLIGYIVLCLVVMGATVYSAFNYFSPMAQELKEQYEVIPKLPQELKSTAEQLEVQKNRQDALTEQYLDLQSFFPNTQQAYASYGDFLSQLENHKLLVNSQRGTITQQAKHPLIVPLVANKELPTAQQKTSAKPDSAKAEKKSSAPKISPLQGEVKPGLNYYHLEFVLEGGYVGYLAARQALVNEIPNLVVHSETVATPKEGDSVLRITAYISIPFVHAP